MLSCSQLQESCSENSMGFQVSNMYIKFLWHNGAFVECKMNPPPRLSPFIKKMLSYASRATSEDSSFCYLYVLCRHGAPAGWNVHLIHQLRHSASTASAPSRHGLGRKSGRNNRLLTKKKIAEMTGNPSQRERQRKNEKEREKADDNYRAFCFRGHF